jgi:hypothetical protein
VRPSVAAATTSLAVHLVPLWHWRSRQHGMSHEIYIYISLAIAYLLQRPMQLRFQLSVNEFD